MGTKTGEVEDLEEQLRLARYALGSRNDEIEEFESTLKKFVKNDDIDNDTAQALADCFGISLTREYTVSVVARFSGTVTIGAGVDIDDLAQDLEATLTAGYGDFECDFDTDEVEVEDVTEEED